MSAFELNRRRFLKATGVAASGWVIHRSFGAAEPGPGSGKDPGDPVAALPKGGSPDALVFSHFPDRLHAFVWRNWTLVPTETMAQVAGAKPEDILRLGRAMGLSNPPSITPDQQRRSYITVIRRNWHLLPYEQLLELLGWTADEMAFALREDDFLFVKLGNLKPKCDPIRFAPPAEPALARASRIAEIMRTDFPQAGAAPADPLFGFVAQLSEMPRTPVPRREISRFSPRYCYSYFALYGDPLLERTSDAYPEGYLARLAASGVDGVWLQAVLQNLAPFPWDASLSARQEERLAALRRLVARARRHGIGVYLYLNEPRSMPLRFFKERPELKGVVEGEHATMCTSHSAVQQWLIDSVAHVCRAVPDLAGFFSITASENLTNCWSHHSGSRCPRCSQRAPADVIAEVNGLFGRGIAQAGSNAQLIAWDWGWADDWAEGIISKLPDKAALMSVSEWSIPIRRGGIENRVGEYSISTVGPGPRAQKHWALARKRGLKTIAKIQAGNTWELSAVPYIPALENVAQHASNLLQAQVDGLMLGWTLGGYPSPNLEVVMEMAATAKPQAPEGQPSSDPSPGVVQALERVATRRFGSAAAPAVVQAWRECSAAFREFPYDGAVVYNAPMQYGPSNLLWTKPTGYRATMIGFPYDDLDGWRGPYPSEVFIGQLEKVAGGFEDALRTLNESLQAKREATSPEHQQNLSQELHVIEAAATHFRSTANQARFVQRLRKLSAASNASEKRGLLAELGELLRAELSLAQRLHAIQSRDSRIGFEATNHYYYVPLDLAEKVLNCRDLLERWLPGQLALLDAAELKSPRE